MPIMAGVDVVPGVPMIGLILVPPIVAMECKTHTWEVNSSVGMPAIAETIAGDIGRGVSGRAQKACGHKRSRKQRLFKVVRYFHD
jgi:hypothetical protein